MNNVERMGTLEVEVNVVLYYEYGYKPKGARE